MKAWMLPDLTSTVTSDRNSGRQGRTLCLLGLLLLDLIGTLSTTGVAGMTGASDVGGGGQGRGQRQIKPWQPEGSRPTRYGGAGSRRKSTRIASKTTRGGDEDDGGSVTPTTVPLDVATARCEPLELPACRQLAFYGHVRLPNALGHDNQHQVARALRRFAPLLRKRGCGEWLSALLCLTYAPPCPHRKQTSALPVDSHLRAPPLSPVEAASTGERGSFPVLTTIASNFNDFSDIPDPVPACRQLCASAWAGCWAEMERAGMHWPHALDCESLPVGPDEDGRDCINRKGRLVNHTDIPIEVSPSTVPAPSSSRPVPKVTQATSRSNSTKTRKLSKSASTVKTASAAKRSGATKQKTGVVTKRKDGVVSSRTVKSAPPKPASGKRPTTGMAPKNKKKVLPSVAGTAIKPRRYDVREVGEKDMFQGWADIQGQGAANDYCRVIGKSPKQRFLSCALAGTTGNDHVFVSKRGFDPGHRGSWFMRDMDKDGRDDYCRCVGRGISAQVACMKAGEHGFYGSPLQPGRQYTFYLKTKVSCLSRMVNPILGVGVAR